MPSLVQCCSCHRWTITSTLLHRKIDFKTKQFQHKSLSEVESGINFAIFSQNATAVTLCVVLQDRQMGRDVAGLRVDKKPNLVNVKSDGTVHVAPRVTPEKVATKDYEPEDHTVKEIAFEHSEKQDGLAVISKNYERREKVIQAEVQKSTDKKTAALIKPESGTAVKETTDANSIKEQIPPQKQSSSNDYACRDPKNRNF